MIAEAFFAEMEKCANFQLELKKRMRQAGKAAGKAKAQGNSADFYRQQDRGMRLKTMMTRGNRSIPTAERDTVNALATRAKANTGMTRESWLS